VLRERYQAAGLFVPQRQTHGAESSRQGEAADAGEHGDVAHRFGQTVEGDAAGEMVDVVHPDVGAEPADHARQDVVAAPVKRRIVEGPVVLAVPVGVLELVLDVKNHTPSEGRDQGGRKEDQQEQLHAHCPDQQPAKTAIPALVPRVLAHGDQPPRSIPIGSR
jgi:hypothetical protein